MGAGVHRACLVRRSRSARVCRVLLTANRKAVYTASVGTLKESMPQSKSEVVRGTLDLMILKTLDTLGPMHGWGIAQRIRQVSKDLLHLNQGTLYPALLRVEQQGWIQGEWKITENNRRARYYSLTRAGKKRLVAETREWQRFAGFMTHLLDTSK